MASLMTFGIADSDTVHQKKIYDVPEAVVYYTIGGGGPLSKDVNLTLEGSGKRCFSEWGEVEQYETHIVERTVGNLNYIRRKDRCERRQRTEVLDVDFTHQKILERSRPKDEHKRYTTAGMHSIGQQMVANVICDMWEGKGTKICLYKGIPLFTEYHALGFYYREEATDVVFDINTSEISKCTLPPYPKQKFSLYTNSIKTKNSKKVPEVFSDRLLAVIAYLKKKKKEENMLSSTERKGLKEMMGEPVFRDQKYLLPKLLETMKKTRACLSQAQDTNEANHCLSDMIDIKSNFTGNEHNKIENWKSDKNTVLEKFETHIALLQSKMKCIRSAKMFSDLSMCMQQ